MKLCSTILFVLFCISSDALAEVYKCKSAEGRFSFQETPCEKNTSGQAIQINLTPPSKQTPAPANDTVPTGNEKEKADQEFKTRHRLRNINDEIDNYQAQIQLNNRQMEKELADLRGSKKISNNNLAGEARNIGISNEMEAVTSKYANKNKAIEIAIETLRQEKNNLQKK